MASVNRAIIIGKVDVTRKYVTTQSGQVRRVLSRHGRGSHTRTSLATRWNLQSGIMSNRLAKTGNSPAQRVGPCLCRGKAQDREVHDQEWRSRNTPRRFWRDRVQGLDKRGDEGQQQAAPQEQAAGRQEYLGRRVAQGMDGAPFNRMVEYDVAHRHHVPVSSPGRTHGAKWKGQTTASGRRTNARRGSVRNS